MLAHRRWADEQLKPWFDAQMEADRAMEAGPHTGGFNGRAALLMACAFDDPVVMRTRAQVRHLITPADRALATDEVHARLADRQTRHPHFAPAREGPSRTEWESVIAAG